MDSLALIEAFGAAWAGHDLDAALSFLSDDCVFEATNPAPDGTRHSGRDAIRHGWQPIFDDASSSFEPEQTFACGDHVVQRWCYRWDGGHVRGVDVFTISANLITEKLSYVKG